MVVVCTLINVMILFLCHAKERAWSDRKRIDFGTGQTWQKPWLSHILIADFYVLLQF